jgi:hypothetical protein
MPRWTAGAAAPGVAAPVMPPLSTSTGTVCAEHGTAASALSRVKVERNFTLRVGCASDKRVGRVLVDLFERNPFAPT